MGEILDTRCSIPDDKDLFTLLFKGIERLQFVFKMSIVNNPLLVSACPDWEIYNELY